VTIYIPDFFICHLFKESHPFSTVTENSTPRRRGGHISKQASVLGKNKNVVMSPGGDLNQELLS
jgi:hypothetical protein